MKATTSEVTTRTITLDVSEREATILCALLGGVVWDVDTEGGKVVYEAFIVLNDQLPSRVASFCDFFTGDVRCK